MKIKILGIFLNRFKQGRIRIRWLTVILLSYLLFGFIFGLLIPFLHARSFSTKIIGDVASKKIIVGSIFGFDYVVSHTAETVYKIAKENPGVNKIIVHLYLGEDYEKGRGYTNEIAIGDITISDLTEARKYINENGYTAKTFGFYWDYVKSLDKTDIIKNSEERRIKIHLKEK